MKAKICYQPIGLIRTPHSEISGMPVQAGGASETEGRIELDPALKQGLADLEGFSHMILIYDFHLIKHHQLMVVPFLDDKSHGIFATRAPGRPNAIGISTVKLKHIEDNLLFFEGADMLDGTPLLDIKPFIPLFDNRTEVRSGWFDEKGISDLSGIKSDNRFDLLK